MITSNIVGDKIIRNYFIGCHVFPTEILKINSDLSLVSRLEGTFSVLRRQQNGMSGRSQSR